MASFLIAALPSSSPTRQPDLYKFLIQTFFPLREVSAETKAETKEDWILVAHLPAQAHMPRGGASSVDASPLPTVSHTRSEANLV